MTQYNVHSQYDKRWIAIQREVSLSERLMQIGVGDLLIAGPLSQELYYNAFLDITMSFERICKLVLNSNYYIKSGSFIEDGRLSKIGHNLRELYLKVDKIADDRDVPRVNIEDKSLMLLDFLTQFAQKGRYYNFISLDKKGGADPIVRWRKIVSERGVKSVSAYVYDSCNGDDKTFVDMHYFNEEGNNIESDMQLEGMMKYSFGIQKRGLVLLFPLIINVITCLDSFSGRTYQKKNDGSEDSGEKIGGMEQVIENMKSRSNFTLPFYSEFFGYIRELYQYIDDLEYEKLIDNSCAWRRRT